MRRALILAIPLIPSFTSAATLKVPQDHATIQAAVDAAAAGDTIAVGKGTYAPFTVVGRTDLTIKGKGKPVVDGGGGFVTVILVSSSTGVSLDGLVVRNTTDRAIEVSGGSDDVTVRRCTFEAIEDGVRAFESANVLVEKNRFSAVANDAIDTSSDDERPAGTNATIVKNRIDGSENGVEIEGSGHVVEKNRIDGSDDSAIEITEETTDVTVVKNRLTNAGDEGIAVHASGNRIEKNSITAPHEDGIDVEGGDNQLIKNKIKDAGDAGIEVGEVDLPGAATGNLVEGNKVTGSATHGFYVADGGNTFRKNRATKNGEFDLYDEVGGNIYEGNRFKTQQVP